MSFSVDELVSRAGRVPVVGVLVRAALKGNEDRDKDMAASIAFFSYFSLFPLLLGAVATVGYFLGEDETRRRVSDLLRGVLPNVGFIASNLDMVFRLRHAAGFVSVIGLLWSSGKMFGAISRAINGALELRRPHPALLAPLRRLLMAAVTSLLLLLAVVASMLAEVVAQLDLGLLGNRLTRFVSFGDGSVAGYVSVFLVLVLLYRFVPFEPPSFRHVLPGALAAALLFEVGKKIFVLYIDNVARLEAVYGPLSSVIVVLLWLYFSARVLLFGGEVVAVRRQSEAETDA